MRGLSPISRPSAQGDAPVSVQTALGAPPRADRLEAEERAHRIFEAAPNAMLVVRSNGIIESVNTAATKLFGYSWDRMVGMRVETLMPQAVRDRHQSHRSEYMSNPKARAMGGTGQALSAIRADGSEFPVEIGLNPLRDGNDMSIIISLVDISQRAQADAEIRRLNSMLEQRLASQSKVLTRREKDLQAILDHMPSMIGYWDANLRNRFGNRAYHDWFGVDPDKLQGKHISEVIGPERYALNLPFIQGALAGKEQFFERSIPAPHGGPVRHTQAHYIPDFAEDGSVLGFYVLVNDVTSIQQANQELAQARDAAQAAAEAKSAFLANMSHEIRTPLNAVLGMAQIGERNAQGSPIAKTFHQILESGQHLLALINDILDLSKIEAGRLHLDNDVVQTAQLLQHLVSLCATRAQAKGLTLTIEESPDVPRTFVADETRVAQVLINLLSNAIKFTTHGGIKLSLTIEEDQLEFVVTDSGQGLTDAEKSRLFQPFEQFRQHTQSPNGGSGLGLAISKRLANLLGGELFLAHSSPQGSAFHFRIPLRQTTKPEWKILGCIHAWGLEHELQTLAPAFAARQCQVHAIKSLNDTDRSSLQVLLASPQAISKAEPQHLIDVVRRGVKVIILGPEAHLTHLPEDILSLAIQMALPASPLRILHAVSIDSTLTPESPSVKRLSGMRILAAEDNPVNRLVLEQMLIQEGATVAFGHDGAQALELVRTHGANAFDIVLCDIQMPVMDGFETALALARIAPQLPIVGLTAHAFETAKAYAREVGMVDYITKPYLLDTLVDVINKHVHKCPSEMREPVSKTDAVESDWQAMLDHHGGNPRLLNRLIQTLSETSQEILDKIDQAIAERDYGKLRLEAHSLKGAALNLHTPTLAHQAAELQRLASIQSPLAFILADELTASLRMFLDDMFNANEHPAQDFDGNQ